MSVLAVGLLGLGIVGALARPKGLPAWVTPVCAAVGALAFGVVSAHDVRSALRPLWAPLAFVAVAVPLAASLDDVGVFDELAALATRSRWVVGRLWILAAVVVALLNLDAAVVLLTPLYIRTALLVDVDPVALAFQPILLASLASGVLPVSNLTNLLAASRLSLTNADFLRHLALPSIAACAVGWCVYRLVFPRRAHAMDSDHVPDRRALTIGLGAIGLFCVLLVVGERLGIDAWAAALATEVLLIGATRKLPLREVPAGTVGLAAALRVLAAGVVAALPNAFPSLGADGTPRVCHGRGRRQRLQQPSGRPRRPPACQPIVRCVAPLAGRQSRPDDPAHRVPGGAPVARERPAGRCGHPSRHVQPGRRDRRRPGDARGGDRPSGGRVKVRMRTARRWV